MRDMREVGIKMNTLEGRLDELYHISDAFSVDADDAEYEKGVLLEIDALESSLILLKLLIEVRQINEDVVDVKLDELREQLDRKRVTLKNYDARVADAYAMGDEGIIEDIDVKAEMDGVRDEVYVLENKVRLLRWMLEKGEHVK